jgi:N-acetylneuraminate synthase
MVYSTSVWDTTSAKEIALHPEFIKIPSACNNYMKCSVYVKITMAKSIFLGMTTKDETEDLVQFFMIKK